MTQPVQPPDANLCPLCGQPNRCAMEVQRESGITQPPCWCTGLDFGADLLARVPLSSRDKACICQGCARPSPGSPQ